MLEVVRVADLSRGYKVVLVQTNKSDGIGDFDKYDVDIQDKSGGTVITASSGCVGEKSGYFWMDSAIEYMERLLLLVEARDMAYHNLLCYSKSYSMNEPRNGFDEEWNRERNKAKMIEKWLLDMSNHWGRGSEKGTLIRVEFDINEIFAE